MIFFVVVVEEQGLRGIAQANASAFDRVQARDNLVKDGVAFIFFSQGSCYCS